MKKKEKKEKEKTKRKFNVKKWLRTGWDLLLMVVGSAIGALALNLFLEPNHMAPGGASGLAMIIQALIGDKLSIGLLVLIINIPLFLLAFRSFGWKFVLKSILGTVVYSLMIDVINPVAAMISEKWFVLPDGSQYVDMILFSIYGGVILGVGFGLVIRAGTSTGGTDLAGQLLNRAIPSITTGTWMLIFDGVVLALAAIAFGNLIYSLYSVIVIWISSKVIDMIIGGLNYAKAAYIISDKWEEVQQALLQNVKRGVTVLNGRGAYSGQEKNVLFCVVQQAQVSYLKRVVSEIDPNAFIVLSDAKEVLGEGFRQK